MKEFLLKDPKKTGKKHFQIEKLIKSNDFLGRISVNDWCEIVSNVLDLRLPWRTLRSRLAESDIQGNVIYDSTFRSQELQCPLDTKVVKVRKTHSFQLLICFLFHF